MRLIVTGREGQIARSLRELATPDLEIVAVGRPELDLARPETILPVLKAARPDVVISAAAYTAVDRAESEAELAFAVNATGAGAVAEAAATLGVPVIHLSTDYVFDGGKAAPYIEDDPPGPLGIYGASKLAGEAAVAGATGNHVIVRTAWVHSPFGANFVRTMVRLAAERGEVRVVADQRGNPTYAPDLARALIKIAGNLLLSDEAGLRGLFHLAGTGAVSRADFARAIFAGLAERGRRAPAVVPVPTADYPAPARRPANSVLDCSLIRHRHGVVLPDWRLSLEACLDRILADRR
jgi:dTDP-4-dehydrorhamnose reductase